MLVHLSNLVSIFLCLAVLIGYIAGGAFIMLLMRCEVLAAASMVIGDHQLLQMQLLVPEIFGGNYR